MIWSDQGNELIHGSVLKYTQFFLFKGHAFWKESIWRQSKILLLKSNVSNCCHKITADLWNIGPQMTEWHSENLAPKFHSEVEAISLTPLPPSHPGKCTTGTFLALPVMSGPLPTELKFRENAASVVYKTLLKDVEVSVRVSLWIY